MKNTEVNYQIEVEGVILTKEAIKTLVNLQALDNRELKVNMDYIKDIICWIVSIMNELDDTQIQKAIDMMGMLNYLKNEFDGLKKP